MLHTKIKPEGYYWCLLCKSGTGKNKYLVCGAYCTKDEAQQVNEDVKDCGARHLIKKCKLQIEI
jgi:hypothetical protein